MRVFVKSLNSDIRYSLFGTDMPTYARAVERAAEVEEGLKEMKAAEVSQLGKRSHSNSFGNFGNKNQNSNTGNYGNKNQT